MDVSSEQRIGPYRVERELGRGGMGVVYLASRSDNTYYKQVAIKLLHASVQNEEVVRRFRSERQILASLDHPNIARLLDGGTTEGGEPYIVMEYVRSAKSLRRYAIDNGLTTRQRLELFLVVCRAVQHAHQHLVIHRDLKPSNILVTAEGEVKLVDFGIAKLLLPSFWPQDAPQTVTGMQAMTPEYASPEQIRGESISVASDVYTLGVVLYELLSGELPFRRTDDAHVLSLLQQVLEKEPTKPSVVAATDVTTLPLRRELEGDLDNIILMAIRKEPEKRYQSAEQMAADIQRFLDGMPIIARAATLQYRAAKFIQRNRALLAAAALVVLSLVGGIISTTREAAIADQQRALAQFEASEASKQRERAEELAKLEQASRTKAEEKAREAEEQAALAKAQTKLADARFEVARKVATEGIFSIELEVRHLPGATPVRKKIVENARKYLDQLSESAQSNAQLQFELGQAYLSLARIQRSYSQGNLGDTAGAARSLKRALEHARTSLKTDPQLQANLQTIAGATSQQADLLVLEGKLETAIPLFEEALKVSRQAAKHNQTLAGQRSQLNPMTKLAEALHEIGRNAECEAYLREAVAITAENARRFDNDTTVIRDQMVALNRLANYTLNQNKAAESRALVEQVTPLLERLEQRNGKVLLLRDRIIQAAFLGRVAERENDFERAALEFRNYLDLCEQSLERDPKNYLAIMDVVFALIHLGETLPKIQKPEEGVPFLRRAVQLSDTLVAIDAKSVQTYQARMNSRKELASAMHAAKQDATAVYREMIALIDKELPPGKGPHATKTADALAEAGDFFLERKPPDGRTAHHAYTKAADLYRELKRDKDVQELTALAEKTAPLQ